MKDLLKPGRPLDEYIDEKGDLRRHCLTCINRKSFEVDSSWGGLLCSEGVNGYFKCNPDIHNPERLNWEPRVDVSRYFLQEEEFNL